jgi:hypothetical protein
MFSRKRSETEDRKMAEASDDLGIPMKPPRPAGAPTTAPVRPAAMPPRAPDLVWVGDQLRPAKALRRLVDLIDPPKPDGEMRRLSVGREITLSGEINSCEKLFIEGVVEANLTNCRDLDIAESGLFKGSLPAGESGEVSVEGSMARSRSSAAARFRATSRRSRPANRAKSASKDLKCIVINPADNARAETDKIRII